MFERKQTRRTRPYPMLVAALVLLGGTVPAGAADLGLTVTPPLVSEGVSCDAPEVQGFPDVWLGHFAGGASAYSGAGGSILLDWRDEKLCFPGRRSCDRWVGRMRQEFHHPEGDYTCLAIR